MGRIPSPGVWPLQRTPLVRHLALCAAALAAYLARRDLGVGNSVLWILGLAALLNFATSVLRWSPRGSRIVLPVSSLFGVAGWIALMLLTGGARSPFVAGLPLEIVLAGMSGSLEAVALTTLGGVAGSWLLHVVGKGEASWFWPAVQTGFLLVTGAFVGYLAVRWERSRSDLSEQQRELQRRLQQLEKDLEVVCKLGRMGENVARLAHGFQNTVHSLRGYARLIARRLSDSEADRELLDGLTTAIDSLEELARSTLGVGRTSRGRLPGPKPDNGRSVVRDVVRDVGASFPLMRWSISLADHPSLAQTPGVFLREILTIVVRNAAEAMHGQGLVAVEADVRRDHVEIRVRDHGPGLSRVATFEPGHTTKPHGHGIGLFLARRLLESRGGALNLSSAEGGGTLCRIELPLSEPDVEHEATIGSYHRG